MGLFQKLGLHQIADKINAFIEDEPLEAATVVEKWDLDTLDGIQSIPDEQDLLKHFYDGTFNESILYKLQRKATEHNKAGDSDLMLACLEKSFNIMLTSDYFYGDYADRYVSYLKKYRQFDKAREVQQILDQMENKNYISEIAKAIKDAKELGTDLLEADIPKPADAKTAMYRGRIYSISGNDSRFPKLPDDIEDTSITLYPFVYGVNEPTICKSGDEIERSNRPFKDTRSSKERKEYSEMQSAYLEEKKNRVDYDWVWEHLPDIAPKSLSGYTKMRNTNSQNYQKIVKAAAEKGYTI